MARFGFRERLGRVPALVRGLRFEGPGSGSELRWAWRGIRARGGRAAIAASLLAVTLAANTLVFATADALVFNRVPYVEPDRLVEIHARDARGRSRNLLHIDTIDAWRAHADLFDGIHGFADRTTFLALDGRSEIESIVNVTPGLIEMLGIVPRWGRPLAAADTSSINPQVVVIAESLARVRFGDPWLAVGRQLETAVEPLLVVGVLPDSFRFPRSSVRIWRAFDPRGPLGQSARGSVQTIARLASGATLDGVRDALAARSASVATATGADPATVFVTAPLTLARNPHGPLPALLLVAALCLLLTACANVVSLELAGAMGRARDYAVQLALGASRAAIARVAMLEGAMIIGAATAAGFVLAAAGASTLATLLPASIRFSTPNTLDTDGRALIFMTAVAGLTWLVAVLPVVFYASRPALVETLKIEGRAAAASRGGSVARRALTTVEVTLAVLLLATALLAIQNYRRIVAFDKGFDSARLGEIRMVLPPHVAGRQFSEQMLERVRAMPGVEGAMTGTAPPMFGESWGGVRLEVDGRVAVGEDGVSLVVARVPLEYFRVIGLPIKAGRGFAPGEPETNVVITEDFARRFWPEGSAIGRTLRAGAVDQPRQVIGVVPRLPSLEEALTGARVDRLAMFSLRPPAPPVLARPQPATAATGGLYSYASVVVRLDSRDRAGEVLRQVRALAPQYAVDFTWTDERYAEGLDAAMLAARIVGAFGLLAFVVSMAGVYAVIAVLVASRAREIGIRVALGAARSDIRRLVFGSGLRLVAAGAVLGLGGAYALALVARSQLAGIQPFDAVTYGAIAVAVGAAAAIAVWQPARQAARVDPAITLRS